MVELTLLEVHFEDSNLSATEGRGTAEKEVRASDDTDREATDENAGEPTDESGSRSGSSFAALVGLAFLVAVAYAARKRLQDGPEEERLAGDDEDFEYTPAEA